ncbi:PilW family protein [Methylosarcina fibrata]|uniref:PilW family protein n=1 Tax=Methylosarcina fibrata TaxID=105972 RepID=UPI000378EFEE|nr:PilW family protein [Methylosarcina fibrata]
MSAAKFRETVAGTGSRLGSFPTCRRSIERIKNPNRQAGMTLIELLIALLIGAFLLGGVLQIFLGTKQSYRMAEGLSRMQENARFAMDLIGQDIRMAGFRGCNSQTAITNNLNSPTEFNNNFNTSLQGFEATSDPGDSPAVWSPSMVTEITGPLVGGSDVITIRRATDDSYLVTAHASGSDDLTLASTTGLSTNDLVVASTCEGSDAFQITAITGTALAHNASPGTPGNATQPLSRSYADGQVYPIATVSYYVRLRDGQPSLYRRINSENADELVEGIEQMQILYGEDTDATPDGTPNYYTTADQVTDMAKVVSIRLSLLVRTIDDNLASEPQAYFYNNAWTTPDDRRLRRVFTTTIAVRNRLL